MRASLSYSDTSPGFPRPSPPLTYPLTSFLHTDTSLPHLLPSIPQTPAFLLNHRPSVPSVSYTPNLPRSICSTRCVTFLSHPLPSVPQVLTFLLNHLPSFPDFIPFLPLVSSLLRSFCLLSGSLTSSPSSLASSCRYSSSSNPL